MQKKPTVIASIILSSVLLAGLVIIIIFRSPFSFDNFKSTEKVPIVSVSDTLSLKELLKQNLDVKQSKTNRKKNEEIWLLGKGRTIIHYLLEIQNTVQQRGGKILSMEEIFYDRSSLASSVFQAAKVQFTDSLNDTTRLELQISQKLFIKGGSSKLAIVFEGINLNKKEQIDFLNSLDYPHAVLVTPWKLSAETMKHLRSSEFRSLVLWLFMESKKINQASANPIRFHHTEAEIADNINKAFELLPESKGVATRYGEEAVEHYNLLKATLQPLKSKQAFFLDLTGVNSSQTQKICEEFELVCDNPEAYNADNSIPKDYIRKKLAEASKNGNAIIILPLNSSIQKELENIKERVEKQGTEITTLQALVEHRQ